MGHGQTSWAFSCGREDVLWPHLRVCSGPTGVIAELVPGSSGPSVIVEDDACADVVEGVACLEARWSCSLRSVGTRVVHCFPWEGEVEIRRVARESAE